MWYQPVDTACEVCNKVPNSRPCWLELGPGKATPGNDEQVFLPGQSEPESLIGNKMPPSTVILMLSEFLPFALTTSGCKPGMACVRDGYASGEIAHEELGLPAGSFSCKDGVREPVAAPEVNNVCCLHSEYLSCDTGNI